MEMLLDVLLDTLLDAAKLLPFLFVAFFIIEFIHYDEFYVLDAKYVIDYFENGERKSIPYKEVVKNGHLIKQGVRPRLEYLSIIEAARNKQVTEGAIRYALRNNSKCCGHYWQYK